MKIIGAALSAGLVAVWAVFHIAVEAIRLVVS